MSTNSLIDSQKTLACAPRMALRHRFMEVRRHSLALASPLSAEDQCVQSMPETSPTKWHLAHTTWFFETMLLRPYAVGYRCFDERYFYLFNSYYEALGPRHPRPQRGMLTRPALDDILVYRNHVDTAIESLIEECVETSWNEVRGLVELGLHHEQQHQELVLTDILHVLSNNPLWPVYTEAGARPRERIPAARWLDMPGRTTWVGHDGSTDGDFAFDNEAPRHEVLLQPFQISDRLVSCGDYAEFIAHGGYRDPQWWLSDGWAQVQSKGWTAPAYWVWRDDWHVFGLHGLLPLDKDAPVMNLSFYEASAYAAWHGARLPTEFEWEAAARDSRLRQLSDCAWQWTRSSYDPYPGYRPWAGAAGEYNGKFMVGQLVLRGGSFATPPGHARLSYRNFFPPATRWQFAGMRLARDLR